MENKISGKYLAGLDPYEGSVDTSVVSGWYKEVIEHPVTTTPMLAKIKELLKYYPKKICWIY